MSDPSQININNIPKKHCDGAVCGHAKEIFMFSLMSGIEINGFSATPRVMKLIAILFADQIRTYEKSHGEINIKEPEIKSPFQVTDFKKPPKAGDMGI